MQRPDKDSYFFNIAEVVASRSTCLRRQYGAVIVKDGVIKSTGYNGSPRNADNCSDVGECWRMIHNIPHGERYEMCQAVHAEANAIINANRADMHGATLYLVGLEDGKRIEKPEPCLLCRKLIRNAQIRRVES
jgi:dCMP deaminase